MDLLAEETYATERYERQEEFMDSKDTYIIDGGGHGGERRRDVAKGGCGF